MGNSLWCSEVAAAPRTAVGWEGKELSQPEWKSQESSTGKGPVSKPLHWDSDKKSLGLLPRDAGLKEKLNGIN